ncbi:hypothetical protein SETIT_6G012300v2 [Setaria italica]|uniref:Uncharacterized protein n=1 Tax=Setaria italica TaxID=4555 RepID=A0A368RGS9_SETIT|nr:hypothetical protein SETIT_6G012300v2 [Setaria italica]
MEGCHRRRHDGPPIPAHGVAVDFAAAGDLRELQPAK